MIVHYVTIQDALIRADDMCTTTLFRTFLYEQTICALRHYSGRSYTSRRYVHYVAIQGALYEQTIMHYVSLLFQAPYRSRHYVYYVTRLLKRSYTTRR